ncbi:MAG: hypothetical protein GC182_14825 [Rhodopseudomonas sp.]|nr:hypothetical protein [Rhodopseudomonas sp.]
MAAATLNSLEFDALEIANSLDGVHSRNALIARARAAALDLAAALADVIDAGNCNIERATA